MTICDLKNAILKYHSYGLAFNYGEGGGYKIGKLWVRNFLQPPSRQGKTFPLYLFHIPPPIL